MTVVIDAVLLLFALIVVRYLAAMRGILDASVTDALNSFVVWLALPALQFGATARMTWADIDHPGYALASGGGIATTFALTMLLNPTTDKRLADRAIEGLNASFANTAFLGIPLGVALFGDGILPALVITTLLTACPLLGFAIVLIEIDLATTPNTRRTLIRALRSLARNPLVVAPLAGGLWAATGSTLPLAVNSVVILLGGAAGPCALVTIGLFLHQRREVAELRDVTRLVGVKLFVQPLATLGFAWFAPMPKPWFGAALVLGSLPTGTGPFVLAKLYGREVATTSKVILLSTILSVVTVSILAALMAR